MLLPDPSSAQSSVSYWSQISFLYLNPHLYHTVKFSDLCVCGEVAASESHMLCVWGIYRVPGIWLVFCFLKSSSSQRRILPKVSA